MRDINLEDTIYPKFTTRSFSTGAPATLGGTPVLSVYEENNLTQITSGVSVSADYDGVTGLNQATIVATAANGYEAGKSYDLVITTGTVGGVSVVGEVVYSFTIEDSAMGINATARTAFEDQYDGTGLNGDTYPASQAQVGNLASGSAAISTVAESYTLTTGTQSSGTVTSTEARDDVPHQHTDTAGAMELYYQFDVGGNGVAANVNMYGYLTSANDSLDVFAYDWAGAGWDQVGTLSGSAATSIDHIYNLTTAHTGTGANLGKVRLRFYAASGLTSATLSVDYIACSYAVVAQSVGYANGAVWIDTTDGTAGTESYVNGVADNPVLTLADAITIASNVGLDRFVSSADTSITFAESHTNEVWNGMGWTLALGGQDVSGIHIHECQSLSGIGTTPTAEAHFINCEVGTMSMGNAHFVHCGFDATLTLTAASDYFFVDCYSQVAGASSPIIDMGAAVGASNVSIRRWAGGITLNNIQAGDVITLDGIFGTVDLNGTGGTVEIRGIAKAVDQTGLSGATVNDDTLKTDIQEDWTDGGRLDVLLDSLISLLDDARGEPGQGAPPVNPDTVTKIDYLYKAWRNKSTQTSTTYSLYDDAGTTVDQKATVSDDATTATRGEIATGP